MRRKLRRGTVTALFVIAVVSLGLWLWTINHKAYLRFRNGVVCEVAHGVFLVHVWDTSFYRIEYPPGLSFGDNHERMWFWLPIVHLNGPPAYYAAPGFHQWVLAVPFWVVSVAGVAGLWLMRRAGWIGRECWQCPACGYDIRGLRQCPECGAGIDLDTAGAA